MVEAICVRVAIGVAALMAVCGTCLASERYYVPTAIENTETRLLADQPLTLDLARCYGRYKSLDPANIAQVINDKTITVATPSGMPSRIERIGESLVRVAGRERGEKVALATLAPESTDDSGQWVPTGAPADIYDAYSRGAGDLVRGVGEQSQSAKEKTAFFESKIPKLLQSCDALQASLAGGSRLGSAKEPIYADGNDIILKGQPRVLAIARCAGRLGSVGDYLDRVAERDRKTPHDFYYPKDLSFQLDQISTLLIKTAAADRDEAVNFSPVPYSELPLDIVDAVSAGLGDEAGFDDRPDFWSIPTEFEAQQIIEGSETGRASCARLIQDLQATKFR